MSSKYKKTVTRVGKRINHCCFHYFNCFRFVSRIRYEDRSFIYEVELTGYRDQSSNQTKFNITIIDISQFLHASTET